MPAKFCPTCKTALLPRGGTFVCRKCSGELGDPGGPAKRRGGATFGGSGSGAEAGRPALAGFSGKRARSQQSLGLPPSQGTSVPGAQRAEVPRSATRWVGQPDGAPHPRLGLFPFDEIRDGQKTFARDVQRAVRRGEHLVAHAPTGLGKTAASLAPALEAALDEGKRLLMLTSKQSQHRIVVDTLRSITERRGARFAAVDVIGKRDMCPRPERDDIPPFAFLAHCNRLCKTKQCSFFTADPKDAVVQTQESIHHVEELIDISLNHGCCPHKVAMEAAKQADVVVCDYNYLFSDMRERIMESLGLELEDLIVVVDEAHNLPDRVRQNFSLQLSRFLLDEARSEAKREADARAVRACTVFAEVIGELSQGMEPGDEVVLSKTDLLRPFEERMDTGSIDGSRFTVKDWIEGLKGTANKLTKAGQDVVRADELQEFLAAWLYGGRAHGRILRIDRQGGWRLLHTLLDPGHVCGPIFKALHASIVMSGTLHPPEMYRDMLGLDAEKTRFRIYGSPYDPRHRPVLCMRGVTTRYKDRTDAMFQRLGTTIVRLHERAGGNTAAFFPSYDLMQRTLAQVQDVLADRGIETVVETKGMGKQERDEVLDVLEGARRHRGGALLLGVLGGSLSEGVDYRDNLLRCVSIVGLPLAPPGREVDLLVEHFERKFRGRGKDYGYVMPAMARVLQAAGRGIRGADDRCAVVLLDERFLWRSYARAFPDDFRLAASDDPVASLEFFFDAFEAPQLLTS